MRNPLMLLTLLAASGAVILAAAFQRRKLEPRDSQVDLRGLGDEPKDADFDTSEKRRGDRPDPPAPPVEPSPDNLEPFAQPGSVDERR